MLRRQRIVAAFLALALAIGLLSLHLATQVNSVKVGACSLVLPLMPAQTSGPFWVQHRLRLLAPDGYGVQDWLEHWGGSPDEYIVRNERTGEAFDWSFEPATPDRLEFDVPTRYALLMNRRWRDDPSSLCRTTPAAPYGAA